MARRALALSGLLRALGGFVIVAAFAMFLFQGWKEGDTLTRYALLVGHMLVLTFSGFAVGHLLHEGKGARLFIALALGAVPVIFAFIGGIMYDHFALDPAPFSVAAGNPLSHMATSPGVPAHLALALAGVSLPVLGFAVWVGFMVMARTSARPLTALYIGANGLLLIPTRDNVIVSVLLLASGLILWFLVTRLRRRDPALATPEGLFARTVLAAPLVVAAGRSIWLYSPDALFFTTLCLIAYASLRQGVGQMRHASGWRSLVEGIACAMAVLSFASAWATIADLGAMPQWLKLPLAAGVLAALLIDLSRRGSRWRASYRNAAALVLVTALTVNLLAFGGFFPAALGLTSGIGALAYGYLARQKAIFAAGLISALIGLVSAGLAAFERFSLGGWNGVVVIGAITIVAGSLLESQGNKILAALRRCHGHFAGKTSA